MYALSQLLGGYSIIFCLFCRITGCGSAVCLLCCFPLEPEPFPILTVADSSTDTKIILLIRQIFNNKKEMRFFSLLFPKDSENLKRFDIGLQEVGAKRCLNGVNKCKKKKHRENRKKLP